MHEHGTTLEQWRRSPSHAAVAALNPKARNREPITSQTSHRADLATVHLLNICLVTDAGGASCSRAPIAERLREEARLRARAGSDEHVSLTQMKN